MTESPTSPSPNDGRDALIVIFGTVLLSPLLALGTAAIYAAMWRQMLSPQFGPGPSYQSWFGISLIVSLALSNLRRQTDLPKRGVIGHVIKQTLAWYTTGGLMLLTAWFVRQMLGWP